MNTVLKTICLAVSFLVGAGMASTDSLFADDKLTDEQVKFFETKIRPVLARECYSCHSAQVGQTKGGLWTDTKEGLLLGGDSGAAIVAGDLDESLLWNAINHIDYSMPPRKKLPSNVIADFKEWIEMGAPDPRARKVSKVSSVITKDDIVEGKKFWAFQPPKKQSVPVSVSDWPTTDIDKFVFAKLESNQLTPGADSASKTLLRRLCFDLVGLPPTPEQITWLEKRWDDDPESAIEHIVDSLLENPQFGERWGRHWLDVVRYAESSGKESNLTFPTAWRYRDYVIDSFNKDKPYNRFVQEQLAGDLMSVKSDEQWAENLVATGFLTLGPKTLTERNGRQFKLDEVDEQIDVTTRVMLGVSVACARCHDHKFDPIPQEDYYAMSGIFNNMTTHYGTPDTFQNRRPSNLLVLPIDDLGPDQKKISKGELKKIQEELIEKQTEMRIARRQRVQLRNGKAESGSNPQQSVVSAIRLQSQAAMLQAKLDSYDEKGNPYTYFMGVQSTEKPKNVRLLERGEFDKPAQEVSRGFPQVLCDEQPKIKSRSSGRLELAQWIGSEENSLTARVMVNRVWQHLLGNGIVRTPENFGVTGQLPTHPELLDHLAIEFVENDWSVKRLVKSIVMSRTYRMTSKFDQEKFEADPENKLLWRVDPKRLDAEALRDSILAISGQLDAQRPRGSVVSKAGDASVRDGNLVSIKSASEQATDDGSMKFGMQRGGMRAKGMTQSGMQARGYGANSVLATTITPIDQTTTYRSVYLPIVRDNLPRALEVFDFAEPSMVVGTREASNTPDQGLYFLNNKFVIEQSKAMAIRLIKESKNVDEQLQTAFLWAYGREPTEAEFKAASKFYRDFKTGSNGNSSRRFNARSNGGRFGGRFSKGVNRDNSSEAAVEKLAALCQAILGSAEFRFLN
ncbi:MAG: PSD1 and planctomycete cytochrome C domain-containing protein [Mariniblastus sp.]